MCYDKHQKELEKVTIKRGNLLEIKAIQSIYGMPKTGSLNNKCIVYTANALKHISGKLQHDYRTKNPTFQELFRKLGNLNLIISPSKTIRKTTTTAKKDLTTET